MVIYYYELKGDGFMEKGNKVRISITFNKRDLEKLDEMADEKGISRSGLLNMVFNDYVKADEMFQIIKLRKDEIIKNGKLPDMED